MGRIGFIGGSGFYDFEGFQEKKVISLKTPFGDPSSEYLIGRFRDREFVFLPRHGKKHQFNPSNVNFRANIWGFKKLGVSDLFSISAVGSMKLKLKIEHIVIPDQFLDFTRGRKNTFFDDGITVHTSAADPVCSNMISYLQTLLGRLDYTAHTGGTYICIEGPHFSSRAESFLYKSWGVDVIGMTNATEAKLCKEAEMCYCSINFITDYDCWHSEEDDASTVDILAVLGRNIHRAKHIIMNIMEDYQPDMECKCKSSLNNAIVTQLKGKSDLNTDKYGLLLAKYL